MKKYFEWMFSISILICVIWFLAAYWLMSLSATHDWLSSFVEIAFASNAAISFEKVRQYLTPLHEIFDKRFKVMKEHYKDRQVQQKVLNYIDDRVHKTFSQVESKACQLMNWTVNFARLACLACIVALLVHEPGRNVIYVPVLITPCIFYFVGKLVVMFVIVDAIVLLFNEALAKTGAQLPH